MNLNAFEMLSIFIFKSGARGMQYGIGTYIKELTEALLRIDDIKIFLISYHTTDCKELSVKTKSARYVEIDIPSPLLHSPRNTSFDKKYASVVVRLLSDFIPQKGNVIFQMNYLDDLSITIKLKETYKYPVISIVHFSQWEQLFNGNKQKLNGLNIDVPTNNIEFTIFAEKEMYRLSDHVVTINPFMKDFIIENYGISPSKLSLIRNGINFRRFSKIAKAEKIKLRRKLGFNSYEKIIMFSGRIDPDKGIYFLVDAFIHACKFRDDLRLVFIGQGNINELMQKCQLFFGRITFTGYLSPQKIMEFYQIADIGVVPSVYEPCSYSRLEMIANWIPLILTRIEGFSDMSEYDQCMFINPIVGLDGEISFNIKELSNAILSLAGDHKLAETIASNAYNNLVVKYSSSRMADEMNSLFRSFIKSKKIN